MSNNVTARGLSHVAGLFLDMYETVKLCSGKT